VEAVSGKASRGTGTDAASAMLRVMRFTEAMSRSRVSGL